MSNKELIKKFYNEVFTNRDLSNLDDYMADDYRQHSPEVADKKSGFIAFIKQFWQFNPKIEMLAVTSDENIVQVFFKCTLKNGHVNKVCDIYRIASGKLQEHWDVIEHNVEDKKTVSGNSIF
ncbi:ester cyclase [Lactobacillus sp. ESL0679]|uniref:nuclear transport factor 2 family protein n=1 Tax=Lactobacillus sp. ESL0679 TaxID=2983209 RepID=UPI0023F695A6|nr:ester cyclase [Lactobacillus sp. ESL0679]MDF7683355.1 ester cyclase [Lactobacillus sp. ESL0679]